MLAAHPKIFILSSLKLTIDWSNIQRRTSQFYKNSSVTTTKTQIFLIFLHTCKSKLYYPNIFHIRNNHDHQQIILFPQNFKTRPPKFLFIVHQLNTTVQTALAVQFGHPKHIIRSSRRSNT